MLCITQRWSLTVIVISDALLILGQEDLVE